MIFKTDLSFKYKYGYSSSGDLVKKATEVKEKSTIDYDADFRRDKREGYEVTEEMWKAAIDKAGVKLVNGFLVADMSSFKVIRIIKNSDLYDVSFNCPDGLRRSTVVKVDKAAKYNSVW